MARKNKNGSGEGSKNGGSGEGSKNGDEHEPREPVIMDVIGKNGRSRGKKRKNGDEGSQKGETSNKRRQVGDEHEPRGPVKKDDMHKNIKNKGKERKEVMIDVPTSSSAGQRAQAAEFRAVRFCCFRWFFGIAAGICWLVSVYTCRPGDTDTEALALFFYLFPLAFSLILWAMKEGDRKLIPYLADPYLGILAYYLIQTLLCNVSLVGSVKINVRNEIHDLYYLGSLLIALLFWELALVYDNDFALADMMLALVLEKLNIKPQYLTGIALVFYFARNGAISKMKEIEKELKNKEEISKLNKIKNCWLATDERLKAEDSESDLGRKYPQFYEMWELLLSLEEEMEE